MLTAMLQYFEEVAREHPAIRDYLPESALRSIDDAHGMLQFAADTERRAFETANKAIRNHNRGVMTAQDYANYDAFRHRVYDTQVAWVRTVRNALYDIPGGYLYANRLPWPGWLPPLRPEYPRHQSLVVYSTSGFSGLPALPVAAAIVLIIAVAVVAAIAIDKLGDGVKEWMLLRAQSSAIETSIEARQSAYEACIAAGTTPAVCAQQVINAIPAPSQRAIDDFIHQRTDRGFIWYAGLFSVAALVAGGGYFGYKRGWFDAFMKL